MPSLNFIRPLEGVISSRYGKQRFINEKARSPHLALDIAAAEGTKIIAPSSGKIILVGNFFYSGNFTIIDHGNGLLSSYSHMSEVFVKEGDIVKQGDMIYYDYNGMHGVHRVKKGSGYLLNFRCKTVK